MKVSVQPLGNGFTLCKLAPRIAAITRTLKRAGKGGRKARLVAAYFGFESRSDAQRFCQFIADHYQWDPVIRTPERLADCVCEVKIRDSDGLEIFTWQLASRELQAA